MAMHLWVSVASLRYSLRATRKLRVSLAFVALTTAPSLSAGQEAGSGLISSPSQTLGITVSTPSAVVSGLSSGEAETTSLGPVEVYDEFESFEIRLEPLSIHDSPPVVTALAASYDGRFLAVAGDDHAIRLVDVPTGRTFSTLKGHTDWVQSLAFTNDSQQLYSAGNDGRVLKWDHRYPVSFSTVMAVDFAIREISLSTQLNMLAVCGFSEHVLLWDLTQERLVHRLNCEFRDQRCVRFSPDGTQVLRGGHMGEICVWDTLSGNELAHYREHRRRVFTAAFSADGTQVTSVGEDRRLIRYDLPSMRVVMERELARAKLMSMCLINDGMVAAAGADNTIHLFDAIAGETVAVLKGHSGTVAVMVPCGEFLASGSFDTTVRIWNLERIGERRLDYGRPIHAPWKMDTSLQIR